MEANQDTWNSGPFWGRTRPDSSVSIAALPTCLYPQSAAGD